jgi:hypothetical protein
VLCVGKYSSPMMTIGDVTSVIGSGVPNLMNMMIAEMMNLHVIPPNAFLSMHLNRTKMMIICNAYERVKDF